MTQPTLFDLPPAVPVAPACIPEPERKRFNKNLPSYASAMVGKKFNYWTVLSIADNDNLVCQCTCGTIRTVNMGNVRQGKSKSCDCRAGYSRKVRTVHGKTLTSEYRVWSGIKKRCYDPSHKSFSRYGGRGIVMCPRWVEFVTFLEDMGVRPSSKHSLDRINNDGNYEPENCRWATATEQGNNRATNRRLTIFGETKTVTQWSRDCNIPRDTLAVRLYRLGWTPEKAVTSPVKALAKRQPKLYR